MSRRSLLEGRSEACRLLWRYSTKRQAVAVSVLDSGVAKGPADELRAEAGEEILERAVARFPTSAELLCAYCCTGDNAHAASLARALAHQLEET